MRLLLEGMGTQGGAARRRPPYFKTKKLAIIGSTANALFAPWDDPGWTIATHCSARRLCKREPDWYFDMHRKECFQVEGKQWNSHYYTWLKRLQTPIFMQENWPEIPMAVRYPLERILAEFRGYFTNHVAYMIALAMTEGVTHLGLFGCQYAAHTEYGVQRGSCEYWLGRFEQYGGHVVLPPKWNSLLEHPKGLYGYASHDDQGRLTGDYRRRESTQVIGPEGTLVTKSLRVLAEGEVPQHRDIGVPVAWERSGFTVPTGAQ